MIIRSDAVSHSVAGTASGPSQRRLRDEDFEIFQAGILVAWASTAWSPWKGRLGTMNLLSEMTWILGTLR